MQAYGEYIMMRVSSRQRVIKRSVVTACGLESARTHFRRMHDTASRRGGSVAVYGVKAGRLHAIEGVL